jgi:putative sterol carrier protein
VIAQTEVDGLKSDIAQLKERAEGSSYMSVATELGDMNSRLQTTLPRMKREDASEVMQAFYPLVFEGMIELVRTDESVRKKLENAQDVTYVLNVEEVGFNLILMIKSGIFSYGFGVPPQSDITMRTNPKTLIAIMTGQTDAFEAFMNGEVQAEGSIILARGLRGVFETLGDKFGFRLMEFSS